MLTPPVAAVAVTVAESIAASTRARTPFLSFPWLGLAALVVAFGPHPPHATAGGAVGPSIIFVDAALATGGNDGSSWADAFQGRLGLQAALNSIPAGSPAQIWVADGEYAPAPPGGDHEASFTLNSGIALLGGFAGGETSVDQRDPVRNVAIFTGDLNSNDVPGPGFIGMSENSLHVVRIINADATCLLDGVTVRAGNTQSQPFVLSVPGGNILVQGGAPMIRQCIVERGLANKGGGLASLASQPQVNDCLFTGNRASFGAGVFHSQGSAGTFTNCRFQTNQLGAFGGGFYNGDDDPLNKPLLQDCLFLNNGGTPSGGSGVGFADFGGQPTLVRCRFIDNTTIAGGGGVMLRDSSSSFRECDFVGNAGQFDGGGAAYVTGRTGPAGDSQFINCRFVGNLGAIFGGPADLINCTVANNDGFITPFVFWPTFVNGDLHLRNCIVWGNHPIALPGLTGIFLGGQCVVDDSLVQLWDGSLPGTGTAALDPQFVDSAGIDGVPGTEDDDLHLLPGSPAIDSGNDASVPRGVEVDLDGNPRFVDGDGDRVAQVDIGAYEHPAAAMPADLNGDGHVTGLDLALLLGQWGRCPARGAPGGCPADLDHNGIVNGLDLAILLAAWG